MFTYLQSTAKYYNGEQHEKHPYQQPIRCKNMEDSLAKMDTLIRGNGRVITFNLNMAYNNK